MGDGQPIRAEPSGFATDYATPVDDFRGKLKSIAYVVDPGTAYQSNRSFPGDNKIWEREMPTAPGLPASAPWAWAH